MTLNIETDLKEILTEIKSDIKELKKDTNEIKTKIAVIETKIEGIEGSQRNQVWSLMVILATAILGIVIAAGKILFFTPAA
jgi:septal ring factor EnvC (AmiA/AmiB activator)